MALVLIALGSNLGNRIAHLQAARDLLKNLGVPGTFEQSPVYQTTPVLCPDESPDFFNCVVAFEYAGTPQQLHNQTQGIEFHLGRDRSAGINAPRVIDVDILAFGDVRHNDSLLEIPHPRMLHRRFVLEPLCEIAAEFRLPGDHATIIEHAQHLDSQEPPLQVVQAQW
jgi:2-amino-4-hydroxy-6-hydroxymethyldihydropteridine diphosphokinase